MASGSTELNDSVNSMRGPSCPGSPARMDADDASGANEAPQNAPALTAEAKPRSAPPGSGAGRGPSSVTSTVTSWSDGDAT